MKKSLSDHENILPSRSHIEVHYIAIIAISHTTLSPSVIPQLFPINWITVLVTNHFFLHHLEKRQIMIPLL